MIQLSHGDYVKAEGFDRAHLLQTAHAFYVNELGMDELTAEALRAVTTSPDVWVINQGSTHWTFSDDASLIAAATRHRFENAEVIDDGAFVSVDGALYRAGIKGEAFADPITFTRLT